MKWCNRKFKKCRVRYADPTGNIQHGIYKYLLAGVPILQSKGWGIHGLFPDEDVGYSCDTNSIEDIKQGILYLRENEAVLKKSIARRQTVGGFRHSAQSVNCGSISGNNYDRNKQEGSFRDTSRFGGNSHAGAITTCLKANTFLSCSRLVSSL